MNKKTKNVTSAEPDGARESLDLHMDQKHCMFSPKLSPKLDTVTYDTRSEEQQMAAGDGERKGGGYCIRGIRPWQDETGAVHVRSGRYPQGRWELPEKWVSRSAYAGIGAFPFLTAHAQRGKQGGDQMHGERFELTSGARCTKNIFSRRTAKAAVSGSVCIVSRCTLSAIPHARKSTPMSE
jgi:hypothetical protein